MDNIRNQNGIGEKELMVVSFGTSYNDNRQETIGAIEDAMERAFPAYCVRRGFTSQIIIDHVAARDGVTIDNVEQALNRAAHNGVKTLVVQPTHLMDGLEYNDLVEAVNCVADTFDQVAIGQPLLTSEEDFFAVADAITEVTGGYNDGRTAIVFMGHGTTAEANAVYTKMQQVLHQAGKDNCFVGTVEADPTVEDVLEMVQAGQYDRVILRPLMIVAGDHANNDMAGDGEDSWKSIFERAGYQVVCEVKGLGELKAIQQLFIQHAQQAMDSLMG